jgi:hypothetical protein
MNSLSLEGEGGVRVIPFCYFLEQGLGGKSSFSKGEEILT